MDEQRKRALELIEKWMKEEEENGEGHGGKEYGNNNGKLKRTNNEKYDEE